jgi:hypothetical protein
MLNYLLLSSVILLSGCSFFSSEVRVDSNGKHQELPMMMPQGQQGFGVHGREVTMAYGALSGTGTVNANGVATAHFMQDKSTIIGLQLNIEAAPENSFYEAWAESSTGSRISLGHLHNPFNDVRHQLRLETPSDLRNFLNVRITMESDDGDPTPSQTVAIGILKQIRR